MIGKRYYETRDRIRNLIINRFFSPELKILEKKAENHACYFCRKNIENKRYILELEETQGISRFFLDEVCYTKAKLFINYEGTSSGAN